MTLALVHVVDTCREHRFELGRVCRLGDLRLRRKDDREAILHALELDVLLRERRTRKRQQRGREDDCCAHHVSLSASTLSLASGLSLASALSLTRTGCAAAAGRRFRKSVVIERLVPDTVPVLIEPANRLLEEARLRIPDWHRTFEDVELVLVHVDGRR